MINMVTVVPTCTASAASPGEAESETSRCSSSAVSEARSGYCTSRSGILDIQTSGAVSVTARLECSW